MLYLLVGQGSKRRPRLDDNGVLPQDLRTDGLC